MAAADFEYDQSLLYDALVKSTEDYIYLCNMKTGMFRYPKSMVEEFDLPGEVLQNAAAVWSERIHEHDRKAFPGIESGDIGWTHGFPQRGVPRQKPQGRMDLAALPRAFGTG